MRGDGCFGVRLLISAAMMIAAICPAVADEFDSAGVKIHCEVEPLQAVRPDWPVHFIANARYLLCVAKPDFKAQLHAALNEHAGGR